MSILIVDDSQFQQLALQEMLRGEGFADIVLADSAAAALDLLRPANDIDVVLLDVDMPSMDGITACRLIKSRPRHRDLPVIMITAKNDVNTLRKAFEAGANDFLGKPPKALELSARVNSAMRLKQETDRRKARERELVQMTNKLKAANEMLRKLAVLDGLTGVANRRYFDAAMPAEWDRALLGGEPLGLVMIDIDHFKAYNDAYGHPAGDQCLRRVAQAMVGCLERSGELLARYGGEEFVAVLPSATLEQTLETAQRLRTAVAALNLEHRGSPVAPHVTISLGAAAAIPLAVDQWPALVMSADQALYRAKQQGRDQVQAGG